MLDPCTNFLFRILLLNLQVTKANFEQESFECKSCLTFDADRLLAFTKLRTDP